MKNITLSVPDDVYRSARIAAARLDTSVSALVRNFLKSLAVTPNPSRAAGLAMTLRDDELTQVRQQIGRVPPTPPISL